MSLTVHPGIGTQTITATIKPKLGDREDLNLNVVGPDPHTDINVPMSITGTILSIWGNPNPVNVAETLGAAIYKVVGTAGVPTHQGYWFDSYNAEDTVEETINKIYNFGAKPFIKNYEEQLYVKSLGTGINKTIETLDSAFTTKFSFPFFKSLEDLSEESQRVGDLNSVAKNNAEYLYIISILSSIIDHFNVRLAPEDTHLCSICHERHKPSEGSLQALRKWLANKLGAEMASKLTFTFQMIKHLRKQYPIHDHYTTSNNIRKVKKEIENANIYFGVIPNDYGHNAAVVTGKFHTALNEIIDVLKELS